MIDKLGKYEIRRELGRGAMGVVYEAWDPMIKRVVAIKTIRADQLAREEAAEVMARFRREAQAAGRLNHRNVVAIYDFADDDGTAFIAMEYVEGRDLRDMFAANERFSIANATRVMEQILDALDYSHKQGVVHRDIKPANVFVQADGTVKVADFGIAHIDTSSLTAAGSVMGTPGYMSPEQVLGVPVDGRSDLFSAGVILYQLVTGERPFAAAAATTTLQKVLKEDPLPPSTLNVQLPDAIDAVVKRALAKKPDERYQTAAEFATDLRRAVGPRSGGTAAFRAAATAAPASDHATAISTPAAAEATIASARTSSSGSAAPAAPTLIHTSTDRNAVPPAPEYAKAKSQAPAIVVVAICLVAVAGAAAWMFTKRDDPAPTVAALPGKSASASSPATASTPAPATPLAPPAMPPSTGSAQPGGDAGRSGGAVAATAAVPPGGTPAAVPTAAPVAPAPGAAAPAVPAAAPGTLVITAVGLADPSNPSYQGETARAQDDARADARTQLVQKAVGLMVEPTSLAKNYAVINDRLLAKSATFVGAVMRESAPRLGKDGLVSVTTEAVVDVKALQKSLNQMTRNDRIDLIRAGGDPRIALRVSVTDADRPGAPPRPAPIAENLLKERIKSFGFRTWSEEGGPAGGGADFLVTVDARLRTLSTRLEASGITITKYAVAAMTAKAVDRASGEEIYFNTALPKGGGSYATPDEALRALGARIADDFSRDLFLAHVNVTGRKVTMVVEGLPARAADGIGRELAGLQAVIGARARGDSKSFDLELAGSGAPADLVKAGVLAPLNAKLGQACLALGASVGEQVSVIFDARCDDETILSRLDTLPPAQLYGAPPARRSAVVKNPETLKKLTL